MSQIISTNIKDCPTLKIVSVIASFDCNRKIIPLYVRIGQESIKIHNAACINSGVQQTTYECEIMDGEYIKKLRLTYFAHESLWAISLR